MATNFVPFQQSSLFSNIASGGGQPLGAVPMDFAKATPYKWNTDPITPDPEVPESGFDMEVFCSMPANANHPMCEKRGRPEDDRPIHERPFMSIEDMENASDKELLEHLKDGWLANHPLGWLDSKGSIGKLKGSFLPWQMSLLFGKDQQMRDHAMRNELIKRGFYYGKDDKGNMLFNIDPTQKRSNYERYLKDTKGQDFEQATQNIIDKQEELSKKIKEDKDYKYHAQIKPTDTSGSSLFTSSGERDDDKYAEALQQNIINSIKSGKSKYSKSLGGFYGGK